MLRATVLRQFVNALAPNGSRPRAALRAVKTVLRLLREHGLRGTVPEIRRHFRQRLGVAPRERLQQWFVENHPTLAELQAQRATVWPAGHPVFTTIVPILKLCDVRDTLTSLREQTYPHWEAVLVVGGENEDKLLTKLAKVTRGEHRFRTLIAGADLLNSAVADARGDFVCLLSSGDRLAPDAFHELASAIMNRPDADVLYADQACLSVEDGVRHDLRLKPGWSPELLLTCNYIGRPAVLRRTLIVAAGGFAPWREAAEEWDMMLRLSERAAKFERVPRCLYYRRTQAHRQPPTFESSEDQVAVLGEHLRRRGLEATVARSVHGTVRATWAVPVPPVVSIIIPNRNNLNVLRQCVEGLLYRTDYPRVEVVIVDNDSIEQELFRYYEKCSATGRVRVVPYNQPFNYSQACNVGAREAIGELLLFLNNDIEVIQPDWLFELVRWALLPGVGVVGTRLLYPNGLIQHAGMVGGLHTFFGHIWYKLPPGHWDIFGSPEVTRNFLAVTGACHLIPRHVFDEVGGYDERYRIAYSDVMFCLHAAKAGYRTVYTPHATLYHHEGFTRGAFEPVSDVETAATDLRRMGFTEDPFYHPALCSDESTPTLRLHPALAPQHAFAHNLAQNDPNRFHGSGLDPCDDAVVRRVLADLMSRFSFPTWTNEEGVPDEWAAARFILQQLRTRPDLRQRFPHALSDGPAGAFCDWLCREAVERQLLPDQALVRIRRVFERKLSRFVRWIFASRLDLRRAFPTALLPHGWGGFLRWLVQHGKTEFGAYGLRDEHIWWYLLECAEDRQRELVNTWRLHVEWQRFFPDALTKAGWPGFVDWVREHYAPNAGEFGRDSFAPVLPPLDELRVLYQSRPSWQRMVPDAFADASSTHALLEKIGGLDSAKELVGRCHLQPVDHPDPQVGMNILAHFCYPSGLQASVRAVAAALQTAGVQTSCRDIPYGAWSVASDDEAAYQGLELYNNTLVHMQPIMSLEAIYTRAGLAMQSGRRRIGMWYWELADFPREWCEYALCLQEIWAPTTFIAKAMIDAGMSVPVTPMLPGAQLGDISNCSRAEFGLPEGRTLFLFMFDMCSVMERKNPLGLIDAFRRAFRDDDRATLVIKVSRGDANPDESARLKAAAREAGVILVDRMLGRAENYGLMNVCDCYVSLHRSEGLGLTMAEAMLLGKPVIATNYSGNCDFMSSEDSLLVSYKLVSLRRDHPPYDRNSRWAEPTLPEAIHWLRWVYEHPDEARALGAKARAAAERVLSPESAGRRMKGRLVQIEAENARKSLVWQAA